MPRNVQADGRGSHQLDCTIFEIPISKEAGARASQSGYPRCSPEDVDLEYLKEGVYREAQSKNTHASSLVDICFTDDYPGGTS